MIENFTHKFVKKDDDSQVSFGKIVPDGAELTFKLNTGEEVAVSHPTEENDALTSDLYDITLLDSPLPIETDPEVTAAEQNKADESTKDTENKTDESVSESTTADQSVDETAEQSA